jgi:hypothetical protein
MKIYRYFFLYIISIPCFAQSIVVESGSKKSADDIYEMANMYRWGRGGMPKDLDMAFQLYKKAAELDNADAQRDFGDYYYGGVKVKQSYSKANYWYEKAAKNDNAKAQMYLGYAYLNGKGVAVNYDKARGWLELAVKQGEPSAMYHLGTMYFDGKGISVNRSKAIPLFQKSCSEGDSNACDKLKGIKNGK